MDLLLKALIVAAVLISARLFWFAMIRGRSARLADGAVSAALMGHVPIGQGRLEAWLSHAGYRRPAAVLMFLGATAGLAALALLTLLVLSRAGAYDAVTASLQGLPEDIAGFASVMLAVSPYLLFLGLAGAPALIVRAARRNRVEAIEQDLAAALELLATLAEAGLGFDSALGRIRESETAPRPLMQEFDIYQRDILAGIPRLDALRKLARRAEVTGVTIFVSALIQAEQSGAGLAETLRTQADDLRERRKLRALLLAQALPVKLVFPLMAFFLPGIFFATLGPVLSQFVEVVDRVIRRP